MVDTVIKGPQEGEITLTQLAKVWGFGKTRTWELVVRDEVIPFRRDRFQIYVKQEDVDKYEHPQKRGRPRSAA